MSEQPATLRMYRTYNGIFEVQNVAAVDAANKRKLYEAYAPHDGFLCQGVTHTSVCNSLEMCQDPGHTIYGPFEHMQYPIAIQKGSEGVLRGPSDRCLLLNGAQPALGACTGTLPKWSLPSDGTLRVAGMCVSTGSELEPAAIRGAGLRVEACDASAPRQRFALTGQGQLRGPDATCVAAAASGELKLSECMDDSSMLGFALNFAAAPYAASSGADFDNVPDEPQYYRSLSYGDLDGDADSDVCIRRADGVYCATNQAGSFSGYARRTEAFADAAGYGAANSGSTLQLADVDGDGRADLCARKDTGIHCARNAGDGNRFEAPSKRTSGDDFGDLVGYGVYDTFYGS
ncbi:MAG TPA: FG-GAP-like repeat-containing protein, partial [Polyangiales bacterium]|nr:FG-GAP-like repeat-containing protein [Polyangiales bacterium]